MRRSAVEFPGRTLHVFTQSSYRKSPTKEGPGEGDKSKPDCGFNGSSRGEDEVTEPKAPWFNWPY